MKTPVGKECKYFFGDYYRGRNIEECSLLKASNQTWSADLCRTCPVPGISQANACEFLQLRGTVSRPLTSGFQRRVQVSAIAKSLIRMWMSLISAVGNVIRFRRSSRSNPNKLPPSFRFIRLENKNLI